MVKPLNKGKPVINSAYFSFMVFGFGVRRLVAALESADKSAHSK
jgi:hypothetical protein